MELISPEVVDFKIKEDGQMKAVYAQEVGRILNANEEDRRNSDENWRNADEDIKKVGRIPLTTWLLWVQAGITDDPLKLLQMLERNPIYKTTEKQLAKKGAEIYVG